MIEDAELCWHTSSDPNWCPRCGGPISQHHETEKREREAGMCIMCIAEAQSGADG